MRFFAPDQKTPGQLKEPWKVGDVFSFVHGPNIENIFCFEILRVENDGSFWRGKGATKLILDPMKKFSKEINEFYDRWKDYKKCN